MVSECLGGTMGIVCGVTDQFIRRFNGRVAFTRSSDSVAL